MIADEDPTLEIGRAVARIHASVLALVCAVLGAAGLFIATSWLLIKGGANVGQHLSLLSLYFYGYSVTWPGAFIGLLWGGLTGGAIGWLIGEVYNLVVWLRHR